MNRYIRERIISFRFSLYFCLNIERSVRQFAMKFSSFLIYFSISITLCSSATSTWKKSWKKYEKKKFPNNVWKLNETDHQSVWYEVEKFNNKTVEDAWNEYKSFHNVDFHGDEDDKRFDIFKEYFEETYEHNENFLNGGIHFRRVYGDFWHLTEDENYEINDSWQKYQVLF